MQYLKGVLVTVMLTHSFLWAQSAFLIDTNAIYTPAALGQKYPSVAFDGSNYFCVWIDYRGRVTQDSLHLYGCRVTPEGDVIDSAGIPISIITHEIATVPESPAIVFGDSIYLVVWADFRNWTWNIYGARINTSGGVLDPDGFTISLTSGYFPSVAYDGTNFLVVWYDARGVYGCRVTTDGLILDPDGVPISTNSYNQYAPSVAFDGTNYLVVWQDPRGLGWFDIYGARVDTAGNVLDTTEIHISSADDSQERPAVVFDGTNYLVVWQDLRGGSDFDIYGARVDTAGLVFDPTGFDISTAVDWQDDPAVIFDGMHFFVTWLDWRDSHPDIYCARVDTSGVVLDPAGIFISRAASAQYTPGIAFDGANCFVVWPDDRRWPSHIYGARVDTMGTVLDPEGLLLSTALYSQYSSSGAFDGTNYSIVWSDFREGEFSYIYGARVDTAGAVLDPSGIAICTTSYAGGPVIAYGGSNYLVVWSGIYGTRLAISGVVLDSGCVFLGSGADPSICFDGVNYLVVYRRDLDIYGARVDTAGAVLDSAGFRISPLDGEQKCPAVVYDGTNYFVVWQDGRNEWFEQLFDIYGTFVDTTGTVMDTLGFPIASIVGNDQSHPSVAFDGVNYFVVWQDTRSGYADIYGARVTNAGVILEPSGIPLCTASSAQYAPSISFDGTNYCVIWEDWRSGNYCDVYGCHVDTSGIVTDNFTVSVESNNQMRPDLAKGSNKYLITYTGFVDTLNNHPANTMRIWGQFHPFVGVEEKENRKPEAVQGLRVYPNPFSDNTDVVYFTGQSVSGAAVSAHLKIYDVLGRMVKDFIPEPKNSGMQFTVSWNGVDDNGLRVPAGIYFVRLETPHHSETQKLILLK